MTAATVAAAEFPDPVRQYQVLGISKTVLNDYPTVGGAGPATHLLEMLARARRRSGAVTIGAERRTNLRSTDPFRQRGPLPAEFFLEEEW
ncbi:MAG: hypothetical protein ACYDD0_04090 [Candidatus Dormibacteria bacterium]